MKIRLSKYSYHFYFVIITLVSILTILACGDNATEPEDIVLPEKDLNFETHIKPLFLNKCASGSGCHSAFDAVNGLNLTDYQTIMTYFAAGGTEQLVIPGQADQSFLYNILLAPLLGVPRMPLDLPSLNKNNINGIKTWINEGAEQFP